MADLRGRVALVTGGERGLGEAVALQLSAAGAAVAVMAPTGGDVDDVAREIEDRGGRALAVTADLTNPTQIAGACDEIVNKFGPVEILINNESAIGPLGPFVKINIEEWVYAEAINLQAPVRLTRLLLPGMLASGWGRIVNVSTGALNFIGQGDTFNAYLAPKAGIEAHTLNLAAQLVGSGVHVNAVRSGLIQMDLRDEDPERIGAAFYQRFRLRRLKGELPTPEVPAVALLDLICSERNGEIVDMGMHAESRTMRSAVSHEPSS